MRGKKFAPSGQGSIVAAVDQAYGLPTSDGRPSNRSTARLAPSAVIESSPGGQLGVWAVPRTRRSETNRAAKRTPPSASRYLGQRLMRKDAHLVSRGLPSARWRDPAAKRIVRRRGPTPTSAASWTSLRLNGPCADRRGQNNADAASACGVGLVRRRRRPRPRSRPE